MKTTYDDILHTIELYRKGWQGKPEYFEQAFDSNALIYFIDAANKRHNYLLQDCFDGWSRTNWALEFELLNVDIVGEIATVKLIFKNISAPQSSFLDIHSLMKIDGHWKIVNKLATHYPQAS